MVARDHFAPGRPSSAARGAPRTRVGGRHPWRAVPPVATLQRVAARGTSLSWRIFTANAVVRCLAAAALLLSPAPVSHPVRATEAAVVVGGLCVMVVINFLIVRRPLAPLPRLADDMARTDRLAHTLRAAGGARRRRGAHQHVAGRHDRAGEEAGQAEDRR